MCCGTSLVGVTRSLAVSGGPISNELEGVESGLERVANRDKENRHRAEDDFP